MDGTGRGEAESELVDPVGDGERADPRTARESRGRQAPPRSRVRRGTAEAGALRRERAQRRVGRGHALLEMRLQDEREPLCPAFCGENRGVVRAGSRLPLVCVFT